ncbi:MAG TPA: hypothetical protein VGX03_15400 [Candidatus Binatia bacterium]|nr:hypothetical protein [Candidatus Binatia bacterium]
MTDQLKELASAYDRVAYSRIKARLARSPRYPFFGKSFRPLVTSLYDADCWDYIRESGICIAPLFGPELAQLEEW